MASPGLAMLHDEGGRRVQPASTPGSPAGHRIRYLRERCNGSWQAARLAHERYELARAARRRRAVEERPALVC